MIERQGPVDAASLAAEHHLGVPVRRHTLLLDRVAGVGCSALLVAINLVLLLTAAELIGENPSLLGWIALLVGALISLRLVLSLIDLNRGRYSAIAYECTEGFAVVSGRGPAARLLVALRFDQISRVWREKVTGRGNRVIQYNYCVSDREGRQYVIPVLSVWKVARREVNGRAAAADRTTSGP